MHHPAGHSLAVHRPIVVSRVSRSPSAARGAGSRRAGGAARAGAARSLRLLCGAAGRGIRRRRGGRPIRTPWAGKSTAEVSALESLMEATGDSRARELRRLAVPSVRKRPGFSAQRRRRQQPADSYKGEVAGSCPGSPVLNCPSAPRSGRSFGPPSRSATCVCPNRGPGTSRSNGRGRSRAGRGVARPSARQDVKAWGGEHVRAFEEVRSQRGAGGPWLG